MEFQPVNEFVIVKDIAAPKYTPSGLSIPESAQGDLLKGLVIPVSEGPYLRDGKDIGPPCKGGDTVIYHKGSGWLFRDETQTEFRALYANLVIGVKV